jgi:hypothetical protein
MSRSARRALGRVDHAVQQLVAIGNGHEDPASMVAPRPRYRSTASERTSARLAVKNERSVTAVNGPRPSATAPERHVSGDQRAKVRAPALEELRQAPETGEVVLRQRDDGLRKVDREHLEEPGHHLARVARAPRPRLRRRAGGRAAARISSGDRSPRVRAGVVTLSTCRPTRSAHSPRSTPAQSAAMFGRPNVVPSRLSTRPG